MNRLKLTSTLAGAALLIGAPVVWHLSEPEDSVGDLEAVTASVTSGTELDAGATDETDTDQRPDLPTDQPTAPQPPEAVTDTEPTPEPVTDPTRLVIPSIDVDAPLVPVGLEEDGGMEIPDDVQTVGWYEPGVLPGEATGTAVLSGHVDSREQGRGALWDLRRMDVDELISVGHEDGSTSQWRVVARTSFPKEELPISDIFTRFGEPRLVVITCDGEFDEATRSYADNVVVYAVPADA